MISCAEFGGSSPQSYARTFKSVNMRHPALFFPGVNRNVVSGSIASFDLHQVKS